jgi:hypothetical protein
MADVVGLRGRAAPTGEGAEPEIVAELEWLLAQARAGDVIALAAVIVRRNLEIGSVSRNPGGQRHLLVAGAAYLLGDLTSEARTCENRQ